MQRAYYSDTLADFLKKNSFEIFGELTSNDQFTTEDYIPLLATIEKIYPSAKTPEATFRRSLQELRDLALIKFEKELFIENCGNKIIYISNCINTDKSSKF